MRKILFTVLLCTSVLNLHCSKIRERKVLEFMTVKISTPELVYQCAKHYKLQHINIVVAQSILETGHYKSDKCINYNNLFGLYDSKNKKYYRFNTWQESVKAYKSKVQYKYSSGDYYRFLTKIKYAKDPKYISKLKNIQKRYRL